MIIERVAPFVDDKLRSGSFKPERLNSFLKSSFVRKNLPKYQFGNLKGLVRFAYEHTEFYKEAFDKVGLKPSDIRSFDDFSKVPFTTSKDVKDYKRFFGSPKNDFVKVFSSSGTTGKPKRIFLTNDDLLRQIRGIMSGVAMIYGVCSDDVVRITYDHGYGGDDWGVRYCLERAYEGIGAMTVLTGGRPSAREEFELFKEFGVSVLMGTPSYLHSLTCELSSFCDVKEFGLKLILLGTEPLPSEIRKKLEKMWGCPVLQGYGMTEMGTSVAAECSQKDGMHVSESDFYVEVVDPKSGEVLKTGEEGELVFSTLSRRGMPLLRYRTHDRGMILKEPCDCGLPFKRIKILGRTDTMMTIGSGDNLYPETFSDALAGICDVINFQVVLSRVKGKDHISVVAETENASESLEKCIVDAMMAISEVSDGVLKSKTILMPVVEFVKVGKLCSESVKLRKVVDKRNLYN